MTATTNPQTDVLPPHILLMAMSEALSARQFDEMFVIFNGEMACLWRAVDPDHELPSSSLVTQQSICRCESSTVEKC
jgi:hypothetical protein